MSLMQDDESSDSEIDDDEDFDDSDEDEDADGLSSYFAKSNDDSIKLGK